MKMKKFLLVLLIFTLTFSMISCLNFDINPDNKPDSGDNQPDNKPDNNPDNKPDDNPGQNKPDDNQPDTDENAVTGKGKTINVYLIAGQSNAVGYGMDTGRKIANSDERFVDGFENVLYYGSQERWNGAPVDNEFQPVKLGMGVASDRSGAEIGIAAAVADSGEMSAVIKCAQGAAHLYPDAQYDVSRNYGTWTSPTYLKNHNVDMSANPMIGYLFTRFENTVTEGIRLLIEEGYTPVIKGVWWMQGEAEMFTLGMASEYRELYETLIYDVRNMLSGVTGYDCSEVPFICGLPKWNTNNSPAPTYQGMVRAAMTTVAGELTNVGYVDCMPLTQHDDWHFDAAGQKYLGENFVAGIKAFEEEGWGLDEKVRIDNEIKLLAGENGLEFRANLTNYSSKHNYKYGFIVVPTSSLTGIESGYIDILNQGGIPYENIECELVMDKIDDTYSDLYFTAKRTDIAYDDLNTSYTAIAYIKSETGDYAYSSKYVADSLARLASEEMYRDGADKEALEDLLNKAINQLNGVSEENSDEEASLELITEDNITLLFSEATSKYNLAVEKSVNVNYFVRFSSDNPEIASVDENGVICAHKAGSTFILVECAGKSKQVNVTVESFSSNGVVLDGVISEGEYVGDVITAHNGGGSFVEFSGMIKNGNLYLSFKLTHLEWSPLSSNWWENHNIEFKLNRGASYTVVFYEGVASYSNNISYGASNTVDVDGMLVTTVEVCVEDVPDVANIMVGLNGANLGWIGAIWHNELNLAYITSDGIIIEKPVNLGNGIVLDGTFDEDVYTENVKNNSIYANGNGADVEIMGTLIDEGVLFGVTVNHTKGVNVHTTEPYDWFTYMNIEFHFNGSGTQFIAIGHNRNSLGHIFTYCKTVPTETGFTSTFEIFIPYEAINTDHIFFTARGWFETGWCDLLNSSWNPSHIVTADGISKI